MFREAVAPLLFAETKQGVWKNRGCRFHWSGVRLRRQLDDIKKHKLLKRTDIIKTSVLFNNPAAKLRVFTCGNATGCFVFLHKCVFVCLRWSRAPGVVCPDEVGKHCVCVLTNTKDVRIFQKTASHL
jgi:hypothetical protein